MSKEISKRERLARLALPVTVEIAPDRMVLTEDYDGAERCNDPGDRIELPRREARRLVKAGHAVRVT